jgi:hypothetical protein
VGTGSTGTSSISVGGDGAGSFTLLAEEVSLSPDVTPVTADRVSVKVRRMDIPRLRAFQGAALAGAALSLFGRRVHGLPLSLLVGAFSIVVVFALVLGLRSYRWLGRREIVFEKDHLLVGEGGPAVHRRDLRMWALGEGEVRLYAADSTYLWRFLAGDGQLDVFRAELTKTFGQPRIVVRRGSPRRRALGLGLAVAGAGAFPAGVSADLYELALVGLLVAAFAFTSFIYSSQKVLRPEP